MAGNAEAVARLVEESREAQGLPQRITDPDALKRVAAVLADGRKAVA